MNLNKLVTERPVISKVICHYLHDASEEERERQSDLYLIIFAIKDGKTFEIYELEDEEILRMSITAILKWIGSFTTHEWYQPIQRLIKVLDGKDAEKEPDPHKPTSTRFEKDGTYVIINGCYNLIDGEYCNGDMVCINWKKGQPSPCRIIYTCEKCHKAKVVM